MCIMQPEPITTPILFHEVWIERVQMLLKMVTINGIFHLSVADHLFADWKYTQHCTARKEAIWPMVPEEVLCKLGTAFYNIVQSSWMKVIRVKHHRSGNSKRLTWLSAGSISFNHFNWSGSKLSVDILFFSASAISNFALISLTNPFLGSHFIPY